MSEKRIAAIDRHLEMLRARRAQLIARASDEQRRTRTRQAIILGTWLLSHRPDVVEAIKRTLQRPQDRHAFGLDKEPSPDAPQLEGNEGD